MIGEITLTSIEQRLVTGVAKTRQEENVRRGRKDAKGLRTDFQSGLALHVNGLGGELAVARVLGRYPTGIFCSELELDDDVGGIEVRTRKKHHWGLILSPRDLRDPHRPWVLVTGEFPTYWVRGWGVEGELTTEQYWIEAESLGSGFPRESSWVVDARELDRDLSVLSVLPAWERDQ